MKVVLLDQDPLVLDEIEPVRADRVHLVSNHLEISIAPEGGADEPVKELVALDDYIAAATADHKPLSGSMPVGNGIDAGRKVSIEHRVPDGDIVAAGDAERTYINRGAGRRRVVEKQVFEGQSADAGQ